MGQHFGGRLKPAPPLEATTHLTELELAVLPVDLVPRCRKHVLAPSASGCLGFRPWPAHILVDSPMCLWTLRVRTAPPFGFLHTQGRLECGNLRCDASEARVAPQPSLPRIYSRSSYFGKYGGRRLPLTADAATFLNADDCQNNYDTCAWTPNNV